MRHMLDHGFEAFLPEGARILILGSFPSVKSREQSFYYGHPQNQFWRLLAESFRDPTPLTIEQKKDFLRKHKIALYDAIESCSIKGSSDASIRDVVPADIESLLAQRPIEKIYCNGGLSYKLFQKYQKPLQAILLPSSSPANARMSFEDKKQIWKQIAESQD